MTTDRELLELAARAMGLHAGPLGMTVYDDGTVEYYKREPSGSLTPKFFNSLQDDGDALRLAVKLDLLECARFKHERDVLMFTKGMDKLTATRRAITCAAAQVQLQKETA